MSSSTFRPAGVRIAGTGMAVPERVVSNADLEASLGVSAEWIVERTGIQERRLVGNGQRTFDLSLTAAARALADAGLAPADLDLLICCTITNEMPTPATACRVVDRLGAIPCGSFDLSAACSGFVAGINTAAAFIESGRCRNVLVVGTEVLSEIVDWNDAKTAALFGDASAAAVVSVSDDPAQGCLYQNLGSDASRWFELYVPRQAGDVPNGGAAAQARLGVLRMDGPAVFRFAVATFQRIIPEALAACGLSIGDVKRFVLHQANARILEKVRTTLDIPRERMPMNIDRYGNTSSASCALVLHELQQRGELEPGDIVLFAAVGGGMT